MSSANLVTIMERNLQLILKEHPESESLIKIFFPILMCEEELLSEHPLKRVPSANKNAEPNAPRFDTSKIAICSEKAGIFSKKLLNTMEQVLPQLSSEIQLIKDCLNPATARRLCKEFLEKEEEHQEIIAKFIDNTLISCAKKKINLNDNATTTKTRLDDLEKKKEELFFIMELLLTRLSHLFVARVARTLPKAEGSINQQHCPYCGSKPSMSIVHEKEGKRDLFCSSCDRTWRFKRTSCPNCLVEEPKNLQIVYQEKNTTERAIHCESCNHYLLEVDIRNRDMPIECVSILSLGMGYLDAIMQEKEAIPFNE